jgi:hypothetical protein
MNESTKSILEKYNPENIITPILEHYNPTSIRGGSFVVIDPKAVKNPDIVKELKMKRGEEFYNNLVFLSKKKQPMYVSALKVVKPSSAYISEISPNNFEEADLVSHTAPGLYYAPITVPTSILKTIVDPMFANQLPIDDEFSQKTKITKGDTLENEYNSGKQPKGTRANGGNN